MFIHDINNNILNSGASFWGYTKMNMKVERSTKR